MPATNPLVKGMWPFQELSLSAATAWANAATVVLAACVLGSLLAAFVLVRANNVKQYRLEGGGPQSSERISTLETELGKAQAAIAEANQRAQQAQAELEKTKAARVTAPEQPPQPQPKEQAPAATAQSPVPNARAPAATGQSPAPNGGRALTDQQVQSLIQRMSAFGRHHVTVGASPVTSESGRFADQLVLALKSAGVSAERNDASAGIQVGSARGVVARFVTGNDKSEQFARSLAEELTADGIVASAAGGLINEIMKELVKQGRPLNDPANEWVVIAVGERAT